MANQKKSGFLVIIRAMDKDGKKVRFQKQCRTHESLAKIELDIKHHKDLKVINYEVWQIVHLKKVPVRRAKKCDA